MSTNSNDLVSVVASMALQNELIKYLQLEREKLRTQLAEARARIEKMKTTMVEAAREIDVFYREATQEDHIQTIHDEDHDLWYARDILHAELKACESEGKSCEEKEPTT